MSMQPEGSAKRFLRTEWERLSPRERRVIEHVLKRMAITRNANREFEDTRAFGERLADQVAAFGGSWTFIILFLIFLVG